MVRRLSVSAFVLIAFLVSVVHGQDETTARAAQIEQLKSQLSGIEVDEALPEAEKNTDVSNLQEAIAFLEKAEEFESREAEFKDALANGAREINRMQAEATALDESRDGSLLPTNLNKASDISAIEAAISKEQVSLTDARSELNTITASITEDKTSPSTIRDRLIAVRAEVVEVESLLSEVPAVSVDGQTQTKQAALKARLYSLQAESSMLEQESLSYEIRMARSGAAQMLAEMRVEVIYDRIGALQNLANARLVSEVDRAEALFRRVQNLAPEADASVARLVKELEILIQETRTVSAELESTAKQLQGREALLRSITADFDRVQRQIEAGGLQGTFARVLLERRRTLPGDLEERQLIRQIRQDLAEAQRRLIELENEATSKPEGTDDIISGPAEQGTEETKEVWKEIRELNSTRDVLSRDLISNYRRLIRELGELDLIEQQIDQESTKYREYLAEQLFWVRSSPVINGATFTGLPSAFAWILGPHRAGELVDQFAAISLWYYVLVACLVGSLLVARKKFKLELEQVGEKTRRISSDHFSHTVTAFFMTVFLALPIPVLLTGLGVGLRNHSGATEWGFALGTSLLCIGIFLGFAIFTSEVAKPKGLGDYHFKWSEASRAALHRLFRSLTPVYILFCLILGLVLADSNTDHLDSLGRMASLFGTLAIGTIFIRFTKPDSDHESEEERANYLFIGARVIYWLNILVTAGLVVLLLTGFVVTALLLINQLQLTILAILLALFLHAMALRWFEIKERRLALAEAIARRRARREAAEEEDHNESEETLVIEAESEQRLDLVEVGEQTRNVIRFLVGVGLLTVLWYLWTELAPVLTVLDRIRTMGGFSIGDFAVTVLVVAVTISISKNLPGLLEMLVLRRFKVIPGTRAAIISLSQYVVIAIGAIVLFRHIGVDWSQFGWIATALSVGLGFGLQEVVANFICGIILLFERPIRVGDVVSVAGVSGTVSKIQMRATTIVNFDREEFVVPNKEFITGSLINMTLSSPINRIMVPVGVAYGSDTEEVLRILSEVANGIEDVMEEPAPVITFESFGDSSLDFMIRVFLPSRENRLGVVTEIHREIDRRFAEAGIEIPFPQRDLHLRSVDPEITLPDKPES